MNELLSAYVVDMDEAEHDYPYSKHSIREAFGIIAFALGRTYDR